jgi:hypothetical protein
VELLQTFREYPHRQKAVSFNLDEVLARMLQCGHQTGLYQSDSGRPSRLSDDRPIR